MASEKKNNTAPTEPFEYEPAECFDKVNAAMAIFLGKQYLGHKDLKINVR